MSNEKIVLDAAELLSQSESLKSLGDEYDAMFTKVTSILNEMNDGWSENLANNFVGKISTAQKGFSKIVEMLMCGQTVAKEAATSFEDVNAVMARQISGAFSGLFENIDLGSLSGMIGTGVNLDLLKGAWSKLSSGDGIMQLSGLSDILNTGKIADIYETLSQLELDEFGSNLLGQVKDGLNVFSDLLSGDMKSDSIESLANLIDVDAIGEAIGFSDGTGMGIIVEGMKRYFDPENPITLDYLEDMGQVAEAFKDGDYLEAITGGFFHTLEGSTKLVTSVVADGVGGIIDYAIDQSGAGIILDNMPWDQVNDAFQQVTGIDGEHLLKNIGPTMSEVFSERVDATIEGVPIIVDYVGEQIGNGVEAVGNFFEDASSAVAGFFGF